MIGGHLVRHIEVKKGLGLALILICIGCLIYSLLISSRRVTFAVMKALVWDRSDNENTLKKEVEDITTFFSKKVLVNVDRVTLQSDQDGDSILDLEDIVDGARKDAENKPAYKSVYYQGGYPPDNQGVCTDVVWRALKNAGYNLKDLIDIDIKNNMKNYPGVNGKPDSNIDFRRVVNLNVFFKKYSESLTLELKSGDSDNLKQWQGGDIVVFDKPEHIGVLSDKRRNDGVPLLIHNAGPYTRESNDLEYWYPKIIGHYRYTGNKPLIQEIK